MNEAYTVRIFHGVAIHQIVTGAQFTVRKPSHIAMREGARPHGGEVLVPGDDFSGKVSPELIWVLN